MNSVDQTTPSALSAAVNNNQSPVNNSRRLGPTFTASKDNETVLPVTTLAQPTQGLCGGVGVNHGFLNVNEVLASGQVVLVCGDFQSLELPQQLQGSFWEEKEGSVFPPEILQELERNLKWC